MKLEEARNNIGAEVELDESTKPYTFVHKSGSKLEKQYLINDNEQYKISSVDEYGNVWLYDLGNQIHPSHLKLKPQNYKIHVQTEAESREAQELFFKLGYVWYGGSNTVKYNNEPYLYAFKNKTIKRDHARYEEVFNAHDAKQITLQDLRDMVAKKKGIKSIGVDLASGEDKTVQVTGTFTNFESRKEMTWEDALDAFKEGKEVELLNSFGAWQDIGDAILGDLPNGGFKFRLAPQRIRLNGEFTKEELMQKIGEME